MGCQGKRVLLQDGPYRQPGLSQPGARQPMRESSTADRINQWIIVGKSPEDLRR